MIGQRIGKILGISRRKAAVCPSQSQFFDEKLILVDEDDRIQGSLSKLQVSLLNVHEKLRKFFFLSQLYPISDWQSDSTKRAFYQKFETTFLRSLETNLITLITQIFSRIRSSTANLHCTARFLSSTSILPRNF